MWRAITEEDVRSSINSIEDDATRLKYLAGDQEDPLVEIIAQVTREVRDAIRSGAYFWMPDDETIVPEGAVHHAVAIIRHRLMSRYDVKVEEARLMEYREAIAYLRDVSRGIRKVENPSGGENQPAPIPFPAINNNRRPGFGWRDQDGI